MAALSEDTNLVAKAILLAGQVAMHGGVGRCSRWRRGEATMAAQALIGLSRHSQS